MIDSEDYAEQWCLLAAGAASCGDEWAVRCLQLQFVPRERFVSVLASLREALANVDAAKAGCPVKSGRVAFGKNCSACGANSSQNCGPEATAHGDLARRLRVIVRAETEWAAQGIEAEGGDAASGSVHESPVGVADAPAPSTGDAP